MEREGEGEGAGGRVEGREGVLIYSKERFVGAEDGGWSLEPLNFSIVNFLGF